GPAGTTRRRGPFVMGGATTTKECNGCATHHNHPAGLEGGRAAGAGGAWGRGGRGGEAGVGGEGGGGGGGGGWWRGGGAGASGGEAGCKRGEDVRAGWARPAGGHVGAAGGGWGDGCRGGRLPALPGSGGMVAAHLAAGGVRRGGRVRGPGAPPGHPAGPRGA